MLSRVWQEVGESVRGLAVLEGLQAMSTEDRALLAQDLARVTKARFVVVSRRSIHDQAREAARFFTRLRPVSMALVLGSRYQRRADLREAFNLAAGVEGAPDPKPNEHRSFSRDHFAEFEQRFGSEELWLAIGFTSEFGRVDCRQSASRMARELLLTPKTGKSMQERLTNEPANAPRAATVVPATALASDPSPSPAAAAEAGRCPEAKVEDLDRPTASTSSLEYKQNGAKPPSCDSGGTPLGTCVFIDSERADGPMTGNSGASEAEQGVAGDVSAEDWSIPEQRDDVLDRIVIRAVVASLNGEVGALRSEEVTALIEQVVSLNVSRFRSYFYRGFHAALNGFEMAAPSLGSNQPRRAWYLAGFLLGARRALSSEEYIKIVGTLTTRELESFEDPNARGAAQKIAPTVIQAACEERQLQPIIDWLRLLGPCDGNAVRALTRFTLRETREAGSRLLPLLEALIRVYRQLPSRHRTADVVDDECAVVLAIAACVRELGAGARARDMLQMTIGPWSADEGGEAALAELTIELNFVDAMTLVPQTESALFDCVVQLEAYEKRDSHLEAAPGFVLFEILVALAALMEGEVLAAERATQLLQRADAMALVLRSVARSAWYATIKVEEFERAISTLSALLSLCAGIESRAPLAVRTLEAWLASGAKLPQPLLKMALENAAILDSPGLASLYAEAVRRVGVEVVDDEALVRSTANPQGRKWLLELLKEPSFAIAPERRWLICAEVGRSAARHPDGEELAVLCIEVLQQLVEQYPKRFGSELIAELRCDAWALVVDENESDEICGWVGRLCGDWSIVGCSLASQFRRAVADEDFELAIDFLELMDHGGHANLVGEGERTWVKSRTQAAASRDTTPTPVRVLFVGGNEVQARWDRAIDDWLAENAPRVYVEWLHTGWGSNWDKYADDVERKIKGVQAVVLMKFVRTKLGEEVRRIASAEDRPWIPCTGHGAASVRRAIVRAAAVVRGGWPSGFRATVQPTSAR